MQYNFNGARHPGGAPGYPNPMAPGFNRSSWMSAHAESTPSAPDFLPPNHHHAVAAQHEHLASQHAAQMRASQHDHLDHVVSLGFQPMHASRVQGSVPPAHFGMASGQVQEPTPSLCCCFSASVSLSLFLAVLFRSLAVSCRLRVRIALCVFCLSLSMGSAGSHSCSWFSRFSKILPSTLPTSRGLDWPIRHLCMRCGPAVSLQQQRLC